MSPTASEGVVDGIGLTTQEAEVRLIRFGPNEQYLSRKFLSALTAGRGASFLIAAYLAREYGQRMISFFSRYYKPMEQGLVALAILAGIGAPVHFMWYRPKAQQKELERGEQVQEFPFPGRHARR